LINGGGDIGEKLHRRLSCHPEALELLFLRPEILEVVFEIGVLFLCRGLSGGERLVVEAPQLFEQCDMGGLDYIIRHDASRCVLMYLRSLDRILSDRSLPSFARGRLSK
jgi:hypothetical protein